MKAGREGGGMCSLGWTALLRVLEKMRMKEGNSHSEIIFSVELSEMFMYSCGLHM